jgi:hypothetical protein
MQEQDLIEQWKREEQHPFSGWDFSHLKGRLYEPSMPWSYEEKVRALLVHADSVLDMGTGGGEKLLEFKDLLPAKALATEGWAPNIPVAQKPGLHGIQVVPYDMEKDARMPFRDHSFRWSLTAIAYDAFEIAGY